MAVKYLTIPEVAEILGVSRRTVYSYMKGRCIADTDGTVVSKYKFPLLYDILPGGEARISTTQLKRFMIWGRQNGTHWKCPYCGHEF